ETSWTGRPANRSTAPIPDDSRAGRAVIRHQREVLRWRETKILFALQLTELSPGQITGQGGRDVGLGQEESESRLERGEEGSAGGRDLRLGGGRSDLGIRLCRAAFRAFHLRHAPDGVREHGSEEDAGLRE